ncbi:MAG: tRNA (guanosine(37)-N1)-methyltransferase TrmD [Planctomycetes bacterium]|nr:tRNA (guanosine(37)-N1)-methyltransferase TrmD [Planctomycetota bacterium]
MRIDILTIFPGMFDPVLGASMMKVARDKGLVEILVHDFRRYGVGKQKEVDDRPYGGGPGMVLRPEPVFEQVEALAPSLAPGTRRLVATPQGRLFDHDMALELSRSPGVLILCGHYEGHDERIPAALGFEEVSIGDFILTGGELPAMVIVDAVARLVPGVLGHEGSAAGDSFAEVLLEGPQYTRPAEYRGMAVPEVLLSGHEENIGAWRQARALERTKARRGDLYRAWLERNLLSPGRGKRERDGLFPREELAPATDDAET